MEAKRRMVKPVPEAKKQKTDMFTGEPIPDGDEIFGHAGYFHKKYAIYGKFGRSPISSKDPDLVYDAISGEPILKSYSEPVVTDYDNFKGHSFGYTENTNELIRPVGLQLKMSGNVRRSVLYIKNTDIAKKMGFKESIFDGVWYNVESGFRPSTGPVPYRIFSAPKVDKSNKHDLTRFGMMSQTYKISEGKKYTFGLEIETSIGYLPGYVAKDLNVACVYDGSIRDDDGNKRIGGEYVTGVLTGDNGFKHLYEITNELSKRCSLNNTCSVHVHIGGLKFTKEEIVMLWKLNQLLEAELYSMMPVSRMTREHCRPMKHINFDFNQEGKSRKLIMDKYYESLFEIVSLGKKPSKTVNKRFAHPAGHNCGWNTRTPRYWWINFVPAMFNEKGLTNYTIEYRMHSASLNFTKIKNWTLICMGITHVAENHKDFVINAKKITLKDVLKLAFPLKWQYLNDYVEERKATFASGRIGNLLTEKIEYVVDRKVKDKEITIIDAAWD